ncbi:nucleosidase [Corynebacterium deserti GIMN1.010]|uniref:Nucleosidase n=1 Tax=Corynebacterium deserti GIMN1.010 TaxID=931089 RepID=A0A0M3QA47_9CORY|nr:nucleosidase [Corynebacterium deserti]ALC06859.1 nucleosidase [Corynebacterium deserti GIMN1.010]
MASILFVSATKEEAAHLPDHLDVIITGVGTTAATLVLTKELATRKVLPQRIVNIGTAGALINGLSGVFEINHAFQHDFSSELIAQMTGKPCVNGIDIPVNGKLPVARLATGNAFISDSVTRQRLASRAPLCDMEGAALVGVAKHFGVPITLLKQVSDSADEEAPTTWFEAVDQGAKELAKVVAGLEF